MLKDKVINFADKYRIFISRILFLVIFFLFLFTSYSWVENSVIDLIFEVSGFGLVVICSLGRLWSAMYIYGYKNDNLVTTGPYSMVRNPLYFFSFLGGMGIGLTSKNIIVLGIIFIFFILYYPFVVLAEEKRLKEIHQEDYLEYMKTTPRFIPKLSLLEEPEVFRVNAIKFREAFFDVMWFFWFYIILKLIEAFHQIGLLPVLFKVP